ncbi:DUF1877 family protein [Streptomyces sp. NPDC003877]
MTTRPDRRPSAQLLRRNASDRDAVAAGSRREKQATDLTSADVYPLGWNEPDPLAWGRPWYEGLTQFFEAAARADDAILVWLD